MGLNRNLPVQLVIHLPEQHLYYEIQVDLDMSKHAHTYGNIDE